MKTRQETVRGITFDPTTLFLEFVGTRLDGEPYEEIAPPKSFQNHAESEKAADGYFRTSPLLYYIRIKAQSMSGQEVTISTVWGDE